MPIKGAFVLPHPPLIVPEVGKGQEKKIQRTVDAYKEAARRIAALKPGLIVLVTPHSVMYADYFHISPGFSAEGDLSRFAPGTPKIRVDYDRDFLVDREQSTGDEVYFNVGLEPVDSAEKLFFTVKTR